MDGRSFPSVSFSFILYTRRSVTFQETVYPRRRIDEEKETGVTVGNKSDTVDDNVRKKTIRRTKTRTGREESKIRDTSTSPVEGTD